jgi:hypothetical protein
MREYGDAVERVPFWPRARRGVLNTCRECKAPRSRCLDWCAVHQHLGRVRRAVFKIVRTCVGAESGRLKCAIQIGTARRVSLLRDDSLRRLKRTFREFRECAIFGISESRGCVLSMARRREALRPIVHGNT